MLVPAPGYDTTSTLPPSASTRSFMLVSPAPLRVEVTSNPAPSSLTSKLSMPSSPLSRTTACEAPAYFCTFCSASSTQKYTVASTSCSYRSTPSASTATGTVALRACDSSATISPLSPSNGG